MTNGQTKRGRFDLGLPQARWRTSIASMHRGEFWMRIGLCAASIATMWLMTFGWNPPFVYREGYTPQREICARVPFEFVNQVKTDEERGKAKASALTFYANNPKLLEQLREALNDQFFQLTDAETYTPEVADVWADFFATEGIAPKATEANDQPTAAANEESFTAFRESLVKDENLERLKYAVEVALLDFHKTGLLKKLEHEFGEGSTTELMVFPKGSPNDARRLDVSSVRIGEVGDTLLPKLNDALGNEKDAISNPEIVAERAYAWLRPKLESTLTLDQTETEKSRNTAAQDVETAKFKYDQGDKLTYNKDAFSSGGIEGGQPLDAMELEILRAEHEAFLSNRTVASALGHVFADLGMYASLFLLAGCYISYREPLIVEDPRKFILALAFITLTVILAYHISKWRTEIIPVIFFAMALSIAWRHDVAWVLSSVVSMILAFALGTGLTGFIVLIAGATSASFLTGTVRNRTKLVYVGLASAALVFPTVIGASVLSGQPLAFELIIDGVWYALCTVLAGLLIAALLPFVERTFQVHTDLSLLELGDATHSLLQELVRRAPGTYNHSINVASISEAAAEAIGANGLLCRVAAYFHDIGKMLKPEYFVENQGAADNKHDQLVPAMSTLVIIAHVKDGVELARQHRLPQIVIDFIEQHHGTTLVEYFYRQATKESEDKEDSGSVDESNFRYPGPKPQTREACVMMLADAVESASRTLVDPAPSRIENLVHDLMLKRLHDGQFDECGITLKELKTIEESLVKSITATYHSRVKYPEVKADKSDKAAKGNGSVKPEDASSDEPGGKEKKQQTASS